MAAPRERIDRFIDRQGRTTAVTLGLRRRPLGDLYHVWLTSSWTQAVATAAVAYLAINALFALAYMATGGIENAHAGSFADAFFFSVQCISTIGFGGLAPATLYANLLTTAEAIISLAIVALRPGRCSRGSAGRGHG